MNTVNEIIKDAILHGACEKAKGISDWKSLAWMFFTPQGEEFCEENKFPTLEQFRGMDSKIADYGVFVDYGNITRSNDANIALIGNTSAELTYTGVECAHRVILMHGAKVHIKASHYAVIHILNVGGCEVEIDKDETVVIL